MPDMHLMLVDGKVVAVDLAPMIGRHRRAHIKHRVDAIGQAADLLMNESFDLEQTWDAGLDAGLAELDLDAAGNVALALVEIEQLRRD